MFEDIDSRELLPTPQSISPVPPKLSLFSILPLNEEREKIVKKNQLHCTLAPSQRICFCCRPLHPQRISILCMPKR